MKLKSNIMENPYKAPESQQTGADNTDVITQLKRQQSYALGAIVPLIPTIPLLYFLNGYKGQIPMFAFICPGFLAGLLVKIIARPYSMAARILPSLVCALPVFLYLRWTALDIYAVFLPIFNFLICLALSRRILNFQQESALYKLRNKL